jgi:beta-lactamase regulating signal transducer with metallopeptidase domain
MHELINEYLFILNYISRSFCEYAVGIFIQSNLLIIVLLAIDFVLRKRVRAVFRYCVWMLVFVKLILPPTFSLPMGIGYWLGGILPNQQSISQLISKMFFAEPVTRTVNDQVYGVVTEMTPIQPSQTFSETLVPTVNEASILNMITWQTIIFLAWLTGVIVFSILLINRMFFVRHLIAQSKPVKNQLADVLNRCREQVNLSRNVEMRLSENIQIPAVCGLFRPVVLMPVSLLEKLSSDKLRTVLIHELVHIKRSDLFVNFVQTILQIIYFYNPFVWLTNVIVRRIRERAVDEMALIALGEGAKNYSNTLIDIAEMVFRKPTFSMSLSFIGIAESKKALERRITHMLNQRVPKCSKLGIAGLIAVIVIGALLLPMGCGTSIRRTKQGLDQSIPELPKGIAEMFGLNKDDILQKFGQPQRIFYGDQQYTLDNLPKSYYMCFEDLSFHIYEDSVVEVTLNNPRYVFGNGIHVGDSEAKVIAAFGPNYTIREFEIKNYLEYEQLDIVFEIYKPQRKAMEINIGREYGNPARIEAFSHSKEFISQLGQKIARLDIDSASLDEVIRIFGNPVKYIWGSKILDPDDLPERFIMVYPGSFRVFIFGGKIVEIRHEQGSEYVFKDKLHVGSSLEEVFAVLGRPEKIVEGEEINWGNSDRILYKDIDGRKGHCYYRRSDHNVRLWFGNYKVAAIYMTRSGYDDGSSKGPFDPEFNRLLPKKIAKLDIDTADLNKVMELFGEPLKYVWGDETFNRDNLPDNFILCYPCDFNVWIRSNKVMEIRHERGAKYAYADKLHIGSTVDGALELLGQPDEIVRGEENDFKDKVLYRDIKGRKGHCYYHRSDQNVRLWFSNDKLIAIYMTRSDFPSY